MLTVLELYIKTNIYVSAVIRIFSFVFSSLILVKKVPVVEMNVRLQLRI